MNQWKRGLNGLNRRKALDFRPNGLLNLVGEKEIILSKSLHFTDEICKPRKGCGLMHRLSNGNMSKEFFGSSFRCFPSVKSVLSGDQKTSFLYEGGVQ